MRIILILLLSVITFIGCKSKQGDSKPTGEDTGYVDMSELPDSLKLKQDTALAAVPNKDSILKEKTQEVFRILKNKKYRALDSLIHPVDGIRFSPYAHITDSDRIFTKDEFQHLFTKNKNKKYHWGVYDGSGDPIILTATEYFGNFVYDGNFIMPNKLQVNKIIAKGNTINNIHSYYKEDDFTESYLKGTKKYEQMDWKSVRLVFRQHNGKYYLIGIIHDQWTI